MLLACKVRKWSYIWVKDLSHNIILWCRIAYKKAVWSSWRWTGQFSLFSGVMLYVPTWSHSTAYYGLPTEYSPTESLQHHDEYKINLATYKTDRCHVCVCCFLLLLFFRTKNEAAGETSEKIAHLKTRHIHIK